MAIPDNYIDHFNKDGDKRYISPAADKVRVDNENFEGSDLDQVLDEISESIGEAGQVNEIIMNGQPYTPTNKVINLGTVITQHQDISGKVDKVTGKGLSTNDYTDAAAALVATIVNKANSSDVYSKSEVDAKGYITNSKDNTTYKVWVGTQAELDALDDYEDNTIYLVGEQAVTPVRFNLTKSLTNVDASDETGAVGAVGSQKVTQGKPYSIHLSPQTGYAAMSVVVMMGNEDITSEVYEDGDIDIDSVTGDVSITAVGNNDVPITAITDISATMTAANTLTLAATANGSTPAISYSLVGTMPKVKHLESGSLVDVDAVVLSGNTLTYKGDCQLRVKATAGNVEYTKTINIAHTTDDAIWFEDDAVLSALSTNSIGSDGNVTYAQAAAATSLKFFQNNTDIVRFKEFKHFTGCTSIGQNNGDKARFDGCTSLECIGLPSTLTDIKATTASTNPFYGCVLKELNIDNINVLFGITFSTSFATFFYAGKDASGIALIVNGQEVTNLVTPDGITTINANLLQGFGRIESFDTGNAVTINGFTANGWFTFDGCASLEKIIVGDSASAIPAKWMRIQPNQTLPIEEIDLGSGISSIPSQAFYQRTSLNKLTLRYDQGVVAIDNADAFSGVTKSNVDLYVPSSLVSSYQSSSAWTGFKSYNAITD